MAYNYQISDIAQEFHEDVDGPTDYSVGALGFWIRGRVGELNNLLFQSFALNDAGDEISPPIGDQEKAVLRSMFMIYWHGRIIRQNLTNFNYVVELTSDGGTVRKAQPSQHAMAFQKLRSDEIENLKDLVNTYRISKGAPTQVAGIDCIQYVGGLPDQYTAY